LKNIVDLFLKHKIVFKSLDEVDKSLLGTRKKIDIFKATDIKGNYFSIFKIDQKSRFLLKNAIELSDLELRLQKIVNHNFKYKNLLISKNICSKSVVYLKDRGWKIFYTHPKPN